MGLLDKVTSGKLKLPHLILIFGADSIGKTTFAAGAPAPIFLGSERGTANIDTNRLPIKTWQEALDALTELATTEHKYQTVVIDSLDWLEPLCWQHLCEKNEWANIEAPGYGKGYVAALTLWHAFKDKLEVLRDKGLNIILIGHPHVKTVQSPILNANYDKFQLKLNDKASALFREYVDVVFFATFELFVKTDGKNNKGKAHGEGTRVMYSGYNPGFDSKDRLGLPGKLPLSWSAFEEALQAKANEKPEPILEEIQEISKQLPEELRTKVRAKMKEFATDPANLLKLKNKALVALGEATA